MGKERQTGSEGSLTGNALTLVLFLALLLCGVYIFLDVTGREPLSVLGFSTHKTEKEFVISGTINPQTYPKNNTGSAKKPVQIYSPPPMFDGDEDLAAPPVSGAALDNAPQKLKIPDVTQYNSPSSYFAERFGVPIPLYKPYWQQGKNEEQNESEDSDFAKEDTFRPTWNLPIPGYKPYEVTHRFYKAHDMPAVPKPSVDVQSLTVNGISEAASPEETRQSEDEDALNPETQQAKIISLTFSPGKTNLSAGHKQTLSNRIIKELNAEPVRRVRIKAFSRQSEERGLTSARRQALERALEVRSYLMENGVKAHRMDVRAFSNADDNNTERVDMVILQ